MSVKNFGGALQVVEARTASVVSEAVSKLWAATLSQWKRIVPMSAEAAYVLVALITPGAVIAFVLGLWRLTADLDWTGTFPISTGLFSHWQVWIAVAIGMKVGGSALAARMIPAAQPRGDAKTTNRQA